MTASAPRASRCLILLGAALAAGLTPLAAASAAPARGCFAGCMAERPPKTDDYFQFADTVKQCRDRCDAAALDDLRKSGLYEAYASCTPEPLSKEEFRDLRAENPSWQAQFNTFTWDVTNRFKDKILTEIEVQTQDMNLSTVSLVATSIIAPDKSGTFVVADFFDGYPAVRYATKVRGAKACTIPR
ncbi:hypothetical protein [Chthonobacter rhizosphaerae]|uniref:hypothetical protein n=1 Tax=Chthonobacter rhizosphaerae TaxID=2735553 RepID=UPI0015EF8789|nr:hypothetical protein [Chthonobacter rhizosphaerae]